MPLFLPALFGGMEASAQKTRQLRVVNPSPISRPDELMVLKRKMLEEKLGKIPENKFISVKDEKSIPQVVQFDDLNHDGKWDEAVFLYSFAPAGKNTFIVSVANAIGTKAVVRAHVRHKRKNADDSFGASLGRDSIPAGQPNTDFSKASLPPFLTEGPAWENDKVGFRIYFDVRNTKDIWGKITPGMMMDTVGADPKVSYHHLSYWGMDILAVGKSLGAGSLALWVPLPGSRDTLVRLGGKNMGPVIYEKVADGPVRAIFRMHYPDWKVLDGLPAVRLTEEISIWGGQYFYESKIRVSNAPQGAKVVTGIVNLNAGKVAALSNPTVKGIFTHDIQSENKDQLGLAILTPSFCYAGSGTAPNKESEVMNTYYVKMNASEAQFRFYAGWEKSNPGFARSEGFRQYLLNEILKYGKAMEWSWQ